MTLNDDDRHVPFMPFRLNPSGRASEGVQSFVHYPFCRVMMTAYTNETSNVQYLLICLFVMNTSVCGHRLAVKKTVLTGY